LEPGDALNPQDPIWPNRGRFVLSNGHTSMLLWSVLHLTGTRAVRATSSFRTGAGIDLWLGTLR
jgi:transketolase